VQGIVYTIGIEMMLAGDIVVAADDCRLCQMESKRGTEAKSSSMANV
jgi:enoyl-CoA hydratase/carnithine racemase